MLWRSLEIMIFISKIILSFIRSWFIVAKIFITFIIIRFIFMAFCFIVGQFGKMVAITTNTRGTKWGYLARCYTKQERYLLIKKYCR